MTIRVLIATASADRTAVTVRVRFTALDGPFAGQHLDREYVFAHPTSVIEIVAYLTDIANLLKSSFGAPGDLQGMVFEV